MTSKLDAYRGIVAAVDRMVNRGDEADAVLRAVVDLLHDRLEHVSWAGISLVEEGRLELGPARGDRAAGSVVEVPIEYEQRLVGRITLELREPKGGEEEDRRLLERVATLIAQHALVAWDTAGEAWSP